jgi:hypothetical protein
LDVVFCSLGTFSGAFHEIVGAAPSTYREQHGPMVAPNCVQMWAMRPRVAAGGPTRPGAADRSLDDTDPSSFGEARAAAAS